jgi:hypothetical protein
MPGGLALDHPLTVPQRPRDVALPFWVDPEIAFTEFFRDEPTAFWLDSEGGRAAAGRGIRGSRDGAAGERRGSPAAAARVQNRVFLGNATRWYQAS